MPQLETCLTVAELEQLATGRLPVDRVEPLAQHLEHCDECSR